MFLFSLIYNILIVPLLYVVFCIGAIFNKKMRVGLQQRWRWYSKLKQHAQSIPADAMLVVFHNSSVGEWEQSAPIIDEMRKIHPNLYVIATFFSPSGFKIVKNTSINYKMYLPLDSLWNVVLFFRVIKPKLWVIAKYDVWPNFLFAANRRGIPVVLASAELAADSSRHRWPMRVFNRAFYGKLSAILPVSSDYAERFSLFYPHSSNLLVTGDTRYDQIYRKAQAVQQRPKIQIFTNNTGLQFIAGSIWPADEKHLMPALLRCINEFPNLQTVLVPHEISETHILAIESQLHEFGITAERYTDFAPHGTSNARVVIINTIGILAALYSQSDIAYVGGSFSSGVHNVMEPAAFGLPILFGPRHINSHEAVMLKQRGAAFQITNQTDCELRLKQLIQDEIFRKEAGQKSISLLTSSLGATQRAVTIIETLL